MTLPEDNSLRSYPSALPKELKKAEKTTNGIIELEHSAFNNKTMHAYRTFQKKKWLPSSVVASFLETARKKLKAFDTCYFECEACSDAGCDDAIKHEKKLLLHVFDAVLGEEEGK